MHVIYLVRRGRKYHTDNHTVFCWLIAFFTSERGRHFDLSALAVQWFTAQLIDRLIVCLVADGWIWWWCGWQCCGRLRPASTVGEMCGRWRHGCRQNATDMLVGLPAQIFTRGAYADTRADSLGYWSVPQELRGMVVEHLRAFGDSARTVYES